MGQRLPDVVLQRISGEPSQGKDVDVYDRDSVQHVAPSGRGVSFLHIDDSEAAGRSFREAFLGLPCRLTAPGGELREGFAMVEGVELRWPPPRRGIPRHEQTSKVFGRHYMLVPLVSMSLVQYIDEVERIQSLPCEMAAAPGVGSVTSGADEPPLGPADWLKPSDRRMVHVGRSARTRPSRFQCVRPQCRCWHQFARRT